MSVLFMVLLLLFLIALLVGLIRPELVIRWGSEKTRGSVFLFYGIGAIVWNVLYGVVTPSAEKTPLVTSTTETVASLPKQDNKPAESAAQQTIDSPKQEAHQQQNSAQQPVTQPVEKQKIQQDTPAQAAQPHPSAKADEEATRAPSPATQTETIPSGNGTPCTQPQIKGNINTGQKIYHTPSSRYYKQTKAEVWFCTEAEAQAAGFRAPQ